MNKPDMRDMVTDLRRALVRRRQKKRRDRNRDET
jgi:hypothetical protein